ncbi:MAG: hypothetical protein GC185_05510 [Alphaproteobacteria bacterium]|nr:hypothetical protein [Alphaproteobacteria bacterium]
MSRKNIDKNKYKHLKPDNDAGKDGQEEGPKKRPLEARAAIFVVRVACVLFFLGYLAGTARGGYTWTWMTYVRSQPVSASVEKAEKYLVRTNQPQKLTQWLAPTKPSEYDETIKALEKYTPAMSPETFFMYSLWMSREGKQDAARMWWMMGNFRLRFDLLRCGGRNVIDTANAFMERFAGKHYDELFKEPGARVKAMREVLDFDAKHPAHNDPTNMCDLVWRTLGMDTHLYVPLASFQWASVRARLRQSTEHYLAEQEPGIVETQKRLEKTIEQGAREEDAAPEKESPEKEKPGEKKSGEGDGGGK